MFKPHKGYRIKRKNENAVKIVGGVLLLAVLVFVGYSAMEPISEYIDRTQQTGTEVTDTSGQITVSETKAADTEPGPDVSETVASLPHSDDIHTGKAVMLADDVTKSEVELISALDRAKNEGATAVIIPMKTEGGIYHYRTSIETVYTSVTDPIRSELTADTIAKAASDRGIAPCAYISVLTDNNRYGDTRVGAYRSPDGSPWIDGDPSKGGKPWISPFERDASVLMCAICTEIADAGFTQIVCDGFVFPEFSDLDVQILGEKVMDEKQRKSAVMDLIQRMTNSARSAGADVLIRIPVRDVIKETGLMDAERLSGCSLLADMGDTSRITKVNGNDLTPLDTAHKTSALYVALAAHTEGLVTYPMFTTSEEDDLIAEALSEIDCHSYYVY